MDWKKNLALAMGAFVSMPAASVATACSNELTARRRLRRRRTSAPVTLTGVSGDRQEQNLRVSVRVPLNKARRVPAACSSYRVDAFMKVDGFALPQNPQEKDVMPGEWTTFEFDLAVIEATTVSASVEVTPTDSGACATPKPVVSFGLNYTDFKVTYLPSQTLPPVHLRPDDQGGPVIILPGPK